MKKLSRAWNLMRLDHALAHNKQSIMTTSMFALLSGKKMAENLPLVARMIVENQSVAGRNLAKTLINGYQKQQVERYRDIFAQHKAGAKHATKRKVAKARDKVVQSGEMKTKFEQDLIALSIAAVKEAELQMMEAKSEILDIKVAVAPTVEQKKELQQLPQLRLLDMAASIKK